MAATPLTAAATSTLESAGVTTLVGTVVNAAGLCHAKTVPVNRMSAFANPGLGASPVWHVFTVDQAGIAVGGAIALHFAARYPERTSAVAVGSPATGIAAERRAPALERLARIEAAGMAFAVEDSMLNGYAPELRGDLRRFERFRTRWLGNDPSSYATIWRMLAAADMQDELARLACPVLVIGGSLDRVRPPQLAEGTAKAIPGARYAEIRTGHYMSVQTPDLLSDTIEEFLTSVGA